MKELLEICSALRQLDDEPSALATVIQVEGSAYRRPGARMLLTPDGRSWGMVSGGCLESDIMDHARRVVRSGQPVVVRYDSSSNDDIIFGTGLGCNGIIDVFIQPVTGEFRGAFLKAVQECLETRRPGAIATLVEKAGEAERFSEQAFWTAEGIWTGSETLASLLNDHSVVPQATVLTSEFGAFPVFIQQLLPPVHVVIFGGWLDVIPLLHMAREVGFRTTVVDACCRASSRRVFREADTLLLCSAEEAVSQIPFDQRTVAVTMNHHFERDQAAVAALTRVTLDYIGTLGPKRRQEKMLNGLKGDGVLMTDEFVQSLHGPAGLDLGAKSPEEIALSIMAEILATLNGRNAKPIRERPGTVAVLQPT